MELEASKKKLMTTAPSIVHEAPEAKERRPPSSCIGMAFVSANDAGLVEKVLANRIAKGTPQTLEVTRRATRERLSMT